MTIIIDFVNLLRLFGVSVSVAEVIDVHKALQYDYVLNNKSNFKSALKSCLIKSKDNELLFDQIFDSFFSNKMIDGVVTGDQKTERKLSLDKSKSLVSNLDDSLSMIERETVNHSESPLLTHNIGFGESTSSMGSIIPSTRGQQRGSVERYKTMILEKYGKLNMFRTKKLIPTADEIKLGMLLVEYEKVSGNSKQSIMEINEQPKRPFPSHSRQIDQIPLYELRSFIQETEQVRTTLLKLGKRLAVKKKRKFRQANQGKRLNYRKVIRKSLATSGVPVDLIFKRKKITEPEVIILNDISGSTRWISNWFFIVAFAASEAFKKLRVFEFDSKVIEITPALKEKTLKKALEQKRNFWENDSRPRNYHSNWESSFEDFFNKVPEKSITKKTTILIQGDCRDFEGGWNVAGGYPISMKWIGKMVKLSKRVIILNPEQKDRWDTGDSVVSYYSKTGAELYQVSTLNDLTKFVFSI